MPVRLLGGDTTQIICKELFFKGVFLMSSASAWCRARSEEGRGPTSVEWRTEAEFLLHNTVLQKSGESA